MCSESVNSVGFSVLVAAVAFVVGCTYDVVAEDTEASLSSSTPSSSDADTSTSTSGVGATGTPTTGETTMDASSGPDSESTSGPEEDVGEVCRPPSISNVNGVFVKAQDVDNGDGSLEFPFASLHSAVSFLNAENEVSEGRKFVFICLGDPFSIGSDVGSLVLTRGLSLIGGVDCSLSSPVVTEKRAVVEMATDIGIRVDSPLDGGAQCFSNLELKVESSFLIGSSPSTIGIIATDADLRIYKSIITVGTGDPGMDGPPYLSPAENDKSVWMPVIAPCAQNQAAEAKGTTLTGARGKGICGAQGGGGGSSKFDVLPTAGEGIHGGAPGVNRTPQTTCKPGMDGGNGTSSDKMPSSGTGLGLLDAEHGFLGSSGVSGEEGSAGGGGGGGGAGFAIMSDCGLELSYGGGGGGGGCGGKGGVAGMYGGASIGIVSLRSMLHISNAIIATSIAGDGGAGGPGQEGGKGAIGREGSGGTSPCSGGAGGQGGKGGWGGAGQGGHSLGVAKSKDSTLLLGSSVMITVPPPEMVAQGGKINNVPAGSDGKNEKVQEF